MEDRGVYYLILAWTFTAIMLIVVALRLYSRAFLTRSIGSDDFTITIGALLSLYSMIQDSIWVHDGLGRHESQLTEAQLSQVNKWTYIGWIVVFISYFFVRTSVMLFVLRLLPPGKKWETRIIFFVFFLNIAITIIATVTYGLHCQPFQAGWKSVPGGHCKSYQDLTITQWVNGILACVIDISTALVPQFLLWKVQMKRSTKLTLDIIFALGLITAGLSIGRVASTNYGMWEDGSWRGMTSNTFALMEEKCGIIFASAPALRQFAAYIGRLHTAVPSKGRQYPDEDFTRFRRRVNLRDILWYRKPSLVEGRVLRPQQLFHPPTSDQTAHAETVVSPPEKERAEQAAQISMLDVIRGKFKNVVTAGHSSTGSPKTNASGASKYSGSTLKTRLWDWESRNGTQQAGARPSDEQLFNQTERGNSNGDQAIRIEQGFDVHSSRSHSGQSGTESGPPLNPPGLAI
ncbi:MAG: hypothetical protein M1820_000082 [Bogoriella megaspora]|nr:MAG: hypothetical protein M1820_000082 [Bogoriella megaspora]